MDDVTVKLVRGTEDSYHIRRVTHNYISWSDKLCTTCAYKEVMWWVMNGEDSIMKYTTKKAAVTCYEHYI